MDNSDIGPVNLNDWRSMFGLREKLSLCFAGLLIIVMALGVQNIYQLNALETSVERILQENFESVIACGDIKEGLARMDNGMLSVLLDYRGNSDESLESIERGRQILRAGLAVCTTNNTLQLGGQRLSELEAAFSTYDALVTDVLEHTLIPQANDDLYARLLEPLFVKINGLTNSIQELNRTSILEQKEAARIRATSAKRQTVGVLIIALVLAFAAIYFSGRWLLLPIIHLTQAAEEVRTGNLDVDVPVSSEDELGVLIRTFNDMTARLRRFQRSQKARLLKSDMATRKIMDNLVDAIALVTPAGEVESVSRVAEEVFGMTPQTRLEDLQFPWIASLAARAAESEDTVFGEREHQVVQVFYEGEEHFYFPSAVSILDDEDELTGLLLIFRDITDLQAQQELKQDAIATVSHQLKTPLTSIQMALHMLRGGKFGELNEKQSELLETAGDESERLLRMVLSLLDMSRIKSGRVMLDCASSSLSQLIDTFIDGVWNEAEARGVTLCTELDADIPEIWVDPSRIEHVFNNLLSNGIRYSTSGSEVRVSAAVGREWIRVDVRDSGPGISREDCAHIFEQFYRGRGFKAVGGAGLGLYIAKQIVEAHGGRIDVDGGFGTGACFSVWLPRADAAVTLGLLEKS